MPFLYSRMRKSQLLASIQKSSAPKFLLVHLVHWRHKTVEAAKFELGQEDRSGGSLHDVDQDLADLPAGYGESCIVLMPRDPQWAYTYWDIPIITKKTCVALGTTAGAANLRRYDINLGTRVLTVFRNTLDELAREVSADPGERSRLCC